MLTKNLTGTTTALNKKSKLAEAFDAAKNQ